ncbi:putative Calcium/calmodulin-dependent protein kinase [Verrucomicrobia bacterium]|nr:putative Calcium/calmodulin-dependent protein kinase [Verrucomicrobiota bacterium]
MEIKLGTIIGNRFECGQELGHGGYGQVFVGHDKELKRPVAIKRLLRSSLGKVDKTEIVQEAQRIAAVGHPNIVAVYDVLETADEVLIIMEFLPGGSLHDRLRTLSRNGFWISSSEAIRLTHAILCGLEAAHTSESGPIIHRDLKPQNILFDKNDTPKLVDFGMSVVGEVSALSTSARAISFEHEGTEGYKSPEQLQGLKLDHRTDLFNAGLIAYLLLGANHPFTDERFLFSQREMILKPYRKLPALDHQPLPKELQAFVLHLLQMEPGKRFDTAAQALSEFENVESACKEMLQERCIRLHDSLVAGERGCKLNRVNGQTRGQ